MMRLQLIKYLKSFTILLLLVATFVSCSKQEEVIPEALNKFSGEIEGTGFEVLSTEIFTLRNEELFSITGLIDTDVAFAIYLRGATTTTHMVSDTGVFVETIDYLRDVAQILLDEVTNNQGNLDSIPQAILDSLNLAFEDIFADSASILADNEAFMFYILNNNIYYSKSGFIELTAIDTVLNRLSGNISIELRNFPQGRKNLVGTLEELQYFEE
jgi:hypothetical protein